MTPRRSAIEEGTAFAVPLRGSYRLAAGVVARTAPGGRILLGYFFEPARDEVPELEDLAGLKASDAVYVAMFGDLNLIEGEWPVIGPLPSWVREDWPVPGFCRPVHDARAFFVVSYSENDIGEEQATRRVSREECKRLPEDGLAGPGFVELRLTRLLGHGA